MTLTKKNKSILILFGVSLCSLAYIFYMVKKNSLPKNTQTSLPGQIQSSSPLLNQTPVSSISIDPNTPLPDIPPTLPVYSAKTSDPDLDSLVSQLTQTFKLTKINDILWANSAKDRYLSIDKSTNSVKYEVDSNRSPDLFSGSDKPTYDQSLSAATKFVASFSQFKDYSPLTSDIQFFYNATGEMVNAPRNLAQLIQIPFISTVNNLPIFFSDIDISPITVLVGQKNQIIKIIFVLRPITVNTSTAKNYYTINQDQIASKVQVGEAKIIQGPSDKIITNNLKSFPPITINKITLEYRYEEKSQTISPYFRLVGFTTPQTSNYSTVTLLLPAVSGPR